MSRRKIPLKLLEDNVLCLKDHILFAIFDEGGVVLNLKNRMSYLLNQSAAGMIELLDGRRSIKEVVFRLAQFYEKPEEYVRDDAENFFKNLIKRDWIHVK